MELPVSIDESELKSKLNHIRDILAAHRYQGILLECEGAMRWLTGVRHQVLDIHPSDPTTVSALVRLEGDSYSVSLIGEPWESPRIAALIEEHLPSLPSVRYELRTSLPGQHSARPDLLPSDSVYQEILREIISVLPEHLEGNQMRKLSFLTSRSRSSLIHAARLIEPGMNGWDIRSLLYETFHRNHLELNQVLLGLTRMEVFNHPMVDDKSTVQRGSIIKLVVGARYFDMIHSATQLVKIGDPVEEREMEVYRALVDFSLQYADEFRSNAREAEIYDSLDRIALSVEKSHGIPRFGRSAHIHHAGGPLSPLGNRDFIITGQGKRRLLPYSQFAINPVDSILHCKMELQGIVLPDSPPLILDEFPLEEDPDRSASLEWMRGSETVRVPTIISV